MTLYAALAGLVAAAGLVLAFSGLRKQEPPAPPAPAGARCRGTGGRCRPPSGWR